MSSDTAVPHEFVSHAKAGNKEAFDALIRQNKLSMYKVAKGILFSDFDVNDAIQETIVKAYINLHSLKDDSLFKTWIIRILINECRHILKKNKKIILIGTIQPIESSKKDEYPSDSVLEYYLSRLEESLRYVVVLFYCNDMKVNEIANILKIPIGTVKSRLSRARKKLKGIIEEEELL